MITNLFKIAYRNLLRNKGISLINITGLAIGMAAAILILLWLQNEISYDRFHGNKNRIYEVWNRVAFDGKISSWNTVSALTAPALEKDLPEVERAVRVKFGSNSLFSVGDKKMNKYGIFVDSGFLQIFDFPMLKGNPRTALSDIHAIVITEHVAKGLFGDQDALGKTIKLDNRGDFTVTGVLEDLPNNTRFDFEYLLPWSYFETTQTQMDFGWSDNSVSTYILAKPNATGASIDSKLKTLKQQYDTEAQKLKWELFAYPLDRWRLYSNFTDGVEDGTGRITFIKLFAVISILILLIACINFMNLSTARSERRAKEVGIRKVIGAQRRSLITQFLVESMLLSLLASVIALLIVQFSLPAYNQLIGKQLYLDFKNLYTWIAIVSFVLVTGILAGSYPAFFLSSFQPVKVLKGTFIRANARVTPRKVFVVVQFTIAIILMISTMVIKQQIDYARNREIGYNKDNLIYHFMTGDIPENYKLIKDELLASGIAKSITKTNSPLTEVWSNGWGQHWEGKDPNNNTSFDRYLSDDGIGATAGLQFVEGRDFDLDKFPTDSIGVIINESALKIMKLEQPIGKVVSDLGIDWHIIGVVKDFILTNPFQPTRPILICGAKSSFMSFNLLQIKLNGENSTSDNLERAEVIFKKFNPDYPFEYRFVDEEYAKKFDNEQRIGILAALFAGLTIFISCLGLFGLAACMAESRVKEIGIRKVLGASVSAITILLSKEFLILVSISFVIAVPIAYWGMSNWLMDYSYRIALQWWVFALAGVLSITIALLTVSYQSIKAALTNPVKNLRIE